MSIEKVKDLYDKTYPDKKDNFEQVVDFALQGKAKNETTSKQNAVDLVNLYRMGKVNAQEQKPTKQKQPQKINPSLLRVNQNKTQYSKI